jgi:hypothetical protein
VWACRPSARFNCTSFADTDLLLLAEAGVRAAVKVTPALCVDVTSKPMSTGSEYGFCPENTPSSCHAEWDKVRGHLRCGGALPPHCKQHQLPHTMCLVEEGCRTTRLHSGVHPAHTQLVPRLTTPQNPRAFAPELRSALQPTTALTFITCAPPNNSGSNSLPAACHLHTHPLHPRDRPPRPPEDCCTAWGGLCTHQHVICSLSAS